MFDKAKLAQLLLRAQGDRTLNSYALLSEVSAAHISRLQRGLLDTPPTPQTLKKLADVARNGITYDSLMNVCGYLNDSKENDTLIIPKNLEGARVAFYGGVEGLTQNQIDKVSEYIEFLKSQNRD